MPIDELKTGLAIIRTYAPAAPIVAQAYIITVPAVKQSAMDGQDRSLLEALGWLLHPVYASYYYPAQTLTELANVTGENAKKIPAVTPMPPPMPVTS